MRRTMQFTHLFLGACQHGQAGPRTTGLHPRWLLASLALALLGACSLPTQPARPAVFDFGPGPLEQAASMPAQRKPALVLDVIEAQPALDSPTVLYRLAYADPLQLRPYALARWSMPPAQLLRQRLRQHFSQQRALLNPGETLEGASAAPLHMQIELEEFSQIFESPQKSSGLLRLRVTLTQAGAKGGKWLAQRSLVTQRDAPSADAAGGVKALAAASEAAALELEQWLQSLGR